MASRGAQNELLASDEFVGISAGISTAIWARYQHAPDRHRSPKCEAPREASKAERWRRAAPSRQHRRRPLLADGLSLPPAAENPCGGRLSDRVAGGGSDGAGRGKETPGARYRPVRSQKGAKARRPLIGKEHLRN